MAVLYKYLIILAITLTAACGKGPEQQTGAATDMSMPEMSVPAVTSDTQATTGPATLGTVAPAESTNKLFKASVTSELEPVVINQMHNWTLHLATADGKPVEDATITVSGSMPAHSHGMPTSPQVTKNLGNGDYLVEGMQFQMGGQWEVNFNITAANQTDEVIFRITLQ